MPFFSELKISEDGFDKPSDIHRHPLTGISVLIVGAGPVGLYTAMECWRKGHNVVRVLERSPVPNSGGDSFSIMGLHILKTWPAMANFLETKSEFPLIAWHKITGERVAGPERPAFGDPTGERLGDDGEPGLKKIFRASRARFTGALLSQVLALGIEVSFGQRVTEYLEDQDGAAVVVEDGTRFEADVVIAADGVGTKSHKLVNGHEVRAMSSKHSIFRTSFPIELVEADPELAARFPLTDEGIAVFELWTGTGLSLSIYRGLTELQFTISHKDTDGTSKESWGNYVTNEQVINVLSEFPEVPEYFKKLVRVAPENAVIDWQLLWRDPQPNWTSPLGRVLQAGDAAHTFIPSSGSGVNQGIEDAVSLATCLQIGGNLKSGMWSKVHNKLRFDRVSCCQLLGFVNQSHYMNPNWGKQAKGDASNVRPDFGWWILGHNPEHYAYANYGHALRHLVDDKPFHNTNIPKGYTPRPWTLKEIYDTLEQGIPLKLEGEWA